MRWLLVAVATLLCAGISMAEKPARTDILLVMPDQFRGDCLSLLKHPAVRTPHLDELASQGVLFRRAYTTVPSCIPARFALLTGLYPQTSGVVGFKAKPITVPTLPGVLKEAGYTTVLVGRNMHQVPRSGDLGYQKQILGTTYVNGDDYDNFLRQAAPETSGIVGLAKRLGVTNNHWQAKPWPLEDRLHPSEWVIDQSRKIVNETTPSQPLFLTTSFLAPHPPLFPPKKHFDGVAQRTLPQPAHGDWVDWQSRTRKGDRTGHRVLLDGQTLRDAQAGYFGLIEHLDEKLIPLIREFRARSENAGHEWVIVLTTDHGEMLGDHGYFRKCEPYEGSASIPFIICGSPGLGFKAGQLIKQPVCLEDVMPTLLALAGMKSPGVLDGVNLVPTLRGEKQSIREWLHFEHAPCYDPEQSFHALADGRYKYIWRPTNGAEQLFDLEKDPLEEHDLARDSGSSTTLAIWRNRLVQRLAARPEGFVKDGKLISGCPYHPLNKGTLDVANGTSETSAKAAE